MDGIHIGARPLVECRSLSGRQAFQKPPLPLGEDGIDRQRAFPTAAHAGEYHERMTRQIDINVPQVMHPRPANLNSFQNFA
ncbi:MAG: hypothetical protein AB7G11_16555, partial [Phycisphaerales bacterium]